jgi:thiamine biosynthesis lipoprotein
MLMLNLYLQLCTISQTILRSAVLIFVFTSVAHGQWQSKDYSTMGTNIRVEVFHEQASVREQGITLVIAEMERINASMSTYLDTSEISYVNKNAASKPVKVSQEFFDLLTISQQISNITNGAFDITYASVGYLYSFTNKERPSDAQITALLDAISYKHVQLNDEDITVKFLHPNVRINLGGIAKGYAVDNAIALLQKAGIKNAMVTAGGDTRLLGDRRGYPWKVGIRNPNQETEFYTMIPLQDTAVSTSGDYERYFDEGGIRYHHIISPKTGKSASQVRSVSIIGPQSVYNDGLSTAIFVLGLAQGIGLINALPNFEVVVFDNNQRMHFSNGLDQSCFTENKTCTQFSRDTNTP